MLLSLSPRTPSPRIMRLELITMKARPPSSLKQKPIKMTLTEFYLQKWDGSFSGTERELKILLSRAADVVDNAIYLSGVDVESVPDELKDRVFKAVCAQADYIDSVGGIDCMNDSGGGSVSLGSFSYSDRGSASGGSEERACHLCSQAESYLLPTGLLYKGVRVL